MANIQLKHKDNIDGAFFVDIQCIACDACVVEAPTFFKMNDDEGHAYVFKQPVNKKEWDKCIEALEVCPVEAIGLNPKIEGPI